MSGQYDLPRYTSKETKEFAKLRYKVKEYKGKPDKKAEDVSGFTTLEEAISKNIQSFEEKIAKKPKKAQEIREEEIEYLLNTMPFIKEMYAEKEASEEDPAAVTDVNKMFKVKSVKNNNTVFQKYLYDVEKVVNKTTMNALISASEQESIKQTYTCRCGGRRDIDAAENMLVCNECGATEVYTESYSFHEQNDSMAYKRSSHFSECLNALQGKEGTTVPKEVVEAVRAEFKKNRISTSSEIKPSKVKQFLKKLGYSAYYDNIYSITNMVTGLPAIKLSASLEKQFKDMFSEIQGPFERHKPPERKNFLSYNYVVYKFSELLGEDDLLPYLPLLKCRQNLHAQDKIWKGICNDLQWEFIPTV
ncbi:putative transcription factor [Acanthocystis turfacea Chlorella virus GM0701.1]|nr:putative transcription factor [Acanthocystis turfacea Chlorella virus GM0701.1]